MVTRVVNSIYVRSCQEGAYFNEENDCSDPSCYLGYIGKPCTNLTVCDQQLPCIFKLLDIIAFYQMTLQKSNTYPLSKNL